MTKMDDLFKRKLEGHSLLPSAEAWNKIESNLEKKSKPVIWWRAAAAILLMGALLGIGYWWSSGDARTQQMADRKKIDSKPETKTEEQAQKTDIDVNQKTIEIVNKQLTQNPIAKSTQTKISNKKIDEAQAHETVNRDNPASETNIDPTVAELSIEVTTAIASAAPSAKEKPIVLEFKLEPVTPEMVAAKHEKKGIKSILTDIKNGETNINFQTLKENLLALNTKKPKAVETRE